MFIKDAMKVKHSIDFIGLDFEQAKAKHLLFKSKLRSILYGIDIDETPVISHFQCALGKWIYGHAINDYGHIPEMMELEIVHADIHTSARELISFYKADKVDEARKGLEGIEKISDSLVNLLSILEIKIKEDPLPDMERKDNPQAIDLDLSELYQLQKANHELDRRITEQSKELLAAKERFELVAKATQDAVWDWNLSNNEIWWNDGFEELFGYKQEDVEPTVESWYRRIHPNDRERVLKGIREAIANGEKNWSNEYRFRKADGNYAHIYDRGYAVHDNEGKTYRVVGSMQDITVTKLAEEELEKKVQERTRELQESNQKLERSNAELEEFAYITSHDLQEPLRKIQIFNNIVLERFEGELSDEVKSYLGKVSDSAKRMSGLIKDLLDYSSLSQSAAQFRSVDLNEILQHVLKDFEIPITQKRASIQSDPLHAIEAVPLQMNQLFFNLISNALKFAKKNAAPSITITANNLLEEKKRTFLQLDQDKDYYEIRFQDDGIGFSQGYAEQIFTIFQRLNERSLFGGYGIGLAICLKVVNNHKGIIFAEGKEQAGASFTVIIPFQQN